MIDMCWLQMKKLAMYSMSARLVWWLHCVYQGDVGMTIYIYIYIDIYICIYIYMYIYVIFQLLWCFFEENIESSMIIYTENGIGSHKNIRKDCSWYETHPNHLDTFPKHFVFENPHCFRKKMRRPLICIARLWRA